MSQERRLVLQRDGELAIIKLVGPGGKPVMDETFFTEIRETVAELDQDDEVRAIVFMGPDKHFSFGLDLKSASSSMSSDSVDDARSRTDLLDNIRRSQSTFDVIAQCTKPTIAAITGWCVGGGVDLAAACDIRVASADAVFSVRESKVAIVADLGSLQRLTGVISDGHLRELALSGDDIDAQRAAEIDLVNHVLASPEEARDKAIGIARRIAQNSPLVLRGIKDILDADRGPRVEAGLRYTAVWNAAFMLSEDLDEAFSAFAEGRKPEFRGR